MESRSDDILKGLNDRTLRKSTFKWWAEKELLLEEIKMNKQKWKRSWKL
jgi:hypothetical protein